MNFHALAESAGPPGTMSETTTPKSRGKMKARREFRSDGLNESADGRMMNVAELQKLRISGDDDSCGNGEAETLIATG